MTIRDYLTVIEVLELHTILLKRYGGATGIRDYDALESAVLRPQSGYYEDILILKANQPDSAAETNPASPWR